jgi:hypothetical protein
LETRIVDLNSKRRGGKYSLAFILAASIIILAKYSSIPNSLATDAASD